MNRLVRVADLSDVERAGLGIEEVPGLGPAAEYLMADGIPLTSVSEVRPLRVINDQRIVALGEHLPPLPARFHRSAQLWRPEWLSVQVAEDGAIRWVTLSGPALRLDLEPYADGQSEQRDWRTSSMDQRDRLPLWPLDAPAYAVAALRWLIDNERNIHLPDQG